MARVDVEGNNNDKQPNAAQHAKVCRYYHQLGRSRLHMYFMQESTCICTVCKLRICMIVSIYHIYRTLEFRFAYVPMYQITTVCLSGLPTYRDVKNACGGRGEEGTQPEITTPHTTFAVLLTHSIHHGTSNFFLASSRYDLFAGEFPSRSGSAMDWCKD